MVFGELHGGGYFGREQVEDLAFERVVGRRGVAESHAAAAVAATDDLRGVGHRVGFVTPHSAPDEKVDRLGEGFGQPVGQQFGHDGRIVVARVAELGGEFLEPDARREGEAAYPVARGGDEVGQRAVVGAARLVAQHGQPVFAPLGVGHDDVVALGPGGEDADDALERQQPFVADAGQQGLRVGEELARFGPLFGVVEHFGIAAREVPACEEETPVDIGFGVGHVEVGEDHAPRVERHDGRMDGGGPVFARFGQRQQVSCLFGVAELLAQGLLLAADAGFVGGAAGTEQRSEYLRVAAGVGRADDRARIDRGDAHGRVHVGGGGAADKNGDARPAALQLLADVRHFVERGGDQTAQADAVGAPCFGFVGDALRIDHHAQVTDGVAVAGHDD